MLADVAQEVERPHSLHPLQVVDDLHGLFTVGVEQAPYLPLQRIDPATHYIWRIQSPLLILETGVTDQSGSTTDQRHWPMPSLLKSLQRQQRHQMTDMQAAGSGVEAAVDRAQAPLKMLLKFTVASGLADQTARIQIDHQAGVCHQFISIVEGLFRSATKPGLPPGTWCASRLTHRGVLCSPSRAGNNRAAW